MAEAPALPNSDAVRFLVACMPKSGSTFLRRSLEFLPGMRAVKLWPAPHRREQEICLKRLDEECRTSALLQRNWQAGEMPGEPKPRGFVAQMHIRYSKPTQRIIKDYRLRPIVLVRDIFDIVISVRDHYINTGGIMAMAYVPDDIANWPEEKAYDFIADMVVPWYINFFMCWRECPDKLLLTYDQVMEDKHGVLKKIAAFGGVQFSDEEILASLATIEDENTRMNKAVSGRGQMLPDRIKDTIRRYAAYYEGVDFSAIGLGSALAPEPSKANP